MSRSILVFFIYYRHYQKKYNAKFYNISQTFWKTVNTDFDRWQNKENKISMEVLYYFMEAEKKNTKKQMEQDLTASLKKGAVLYLDGTLSSPKKISSAVFREDHFYMADFVTDERGYIREIRYDSIC